MRNMTKGKEGGEGGGTRLGEKSEECGRYSMAFGLQKS